MEAAVTAVEDQRDGSTGFFLHLGAAARILVSVVMIPDRGGSGDVSHGDEMSQIPPSHVRAREAPQSTPRLAGEILAMLDRLKDARPCPWGAGGRQRLR